MSPLEDQKTPFEEPKSQTDEYENADPEKGEIADGDGEIAGSNIEEFIVDDEDDVISVCASDKTYVNDTNLSFDYHHRL